MSVYVMSARGFDTSFTITNSLGFLLCLYSAEMYVQEKLEFKRYIIKCDHIRLELFNINFVGESKMWAKILAGTMPHFPYLIVHRNGLKPFLCTIRFDLSLSLKFEWKHMCM